MINNLIYGFFFHFLLQDVEVAHDKDVVVVTIHLKKQDFIFGLSLLSVILLTGKSSSEFKPIT